MSVSVVRNDKLVLYARSMRKNMTVEEGLLWHKFLKLYKPKITRQKIMEYYILDFYCSAVKLAIEIDGSQHYDPVGMENDKSRSEHLGRLGIEVMRFTNTDVKRHFYEVCSQIDNRIKEKLGKYNPPQSPGNKVK